MIFKANQMKENFYMHLAYLLTHLIKIFVILCLPKEYVLLMKA